MILSFILRHFFRRDILDREGTELYLTRWYLWGRPRMSDGSSPFLEDGAPKPGIIWPEGIGVYLHRFNKGDDDRAHLHNHPWMWCFSLILSGGYIEERVSLDLNKLLYGTPLAISRRVLRFGSINRITPRDFHRVDLIDKEAWTLFVVGPKFRGWGFLNRFNAKFTPWREHHEKMRRKGKRV